MPKVKKGRKNGTKSKDEPKVKTRTRVAKKVRKEQPVKVKLEPDECTFTYRDAEKEDEADRNACGHKIMSVSEYVRSIRPELVGDIKPKIEPIFKQEPPDSDIDESNSRIDGTSNDELINGPAIKTKPKEKSTDCSICHKSFKDKIALKSHQIYHREKTQECDFCGKLFGRKTHLNRHIQTHVVNREKYPCDICKKEFKRKDHLKVHQDLHRSSQKSFECRICEKKFIHSTYLKKHIHNVHTGKEKQKCTFCDSEFASNPNLITHMRSLHFTLLRQEDKGTGDLHQIFQGVRTYECYRCKYPTRTLTHTKRHLKICKGLYRSVKCDLCHKQYTSVVNFKKHWRYVHSINQGKWEKREQMLKEAEKTFECIDCKASFIKRIGLFHHMKFNCSKRIFKCDYCSEKFPRQIDKDDHHRRMHAILMQTTHDQKYECHICKVYVTARMATKHLAKKHQIYTVFKLNICRLKLPEQLENP